MSADYAREKTYLAVLTLASGSAPLRDRLADAYESQLRRLQVHQIPWPDLRQRYEDICDEIAPAGGDPRDALAAWPDEDVRRIAQAVVDLFSSVADRQTGKN